MFKLLMHLILASSISFMGFYGLHNIPLKNKIYTNLDKYLENIGAESLLKHYDCIYTIMFLVLILTPLMIINTSTRIAGILSFLSLSIVTFFGYFEGDNLLKEDFWQMVVVCLGLLSASLTK